MGTTASDVMDQVIAAQYLAEANGDLDAVMATFTDDAVHDVVDLDRIRAQLHAAA